MKKGYTFTETITALILLGILFAVTIVNVKKLSINSNMARFKKGYANLEKAIASLTSDESIYSAQSGFKDTSLVKMGFDNEDEGFEVVDVIGKSATSKFREAVKYKMNVVKHDLECSIYSVDKTDGTNGGKISNNCFMTDDGVVFGIPDTDFRKKGTMVIRDYDNDKIVVSPVTMYVDYDGKIKDPEKDAFVIGVGADGNMQFIRTFDNCKDEPKVLQCNLDNYIKSGNISEIDESDKEE